MAMTPEKLIEQITNDPIGFIIASIIVIVILFGIIWIYKKITTKQDMLKRSQKTGSTEEKKQ